MTETGAGRRGIWPLQALNFFMADMQAGIGPFLGVFLQSHGWQAGPIGSVMTLGGVAGMLVTAPAGALIAAAVIRNWGVFPVQALDGIGAGLQSVAVPGLVARILDGTGRVNVGQGAVMTVQGVGAALSPALGGWMAQGLGYRPTFLILGAFSLGSVALWVAFSSILRPACAPAADRSSQPLTA